MKGLFLILIIFFQLISNIPEKTFYNIDLLENNSENESKSDTEFKEELNISILTKINKTYKVLINYSNRFFKDKYIKLVFNNEFSNISLLKSDKLYLWNSFFRI